MSRLTDPAGAPVPPASVADTAQLAAWLEEVPAWLDQAAAAPEPFRWVKRLTPADVGSLDARDAVAAWASGRRLGGPDGLAVAAAAEDRLAQLQPDIVARLRERVGSHLDVDELGALRAAAWDSTVDAAGQAAPREAAFAWVLAQQAAEAGSVDAGRASAALREVLASRAPHVVAHFDAEVEAGGAPAPAVLAAVDELAPPPRAPQPLEADALGHDRLLDWRLVPGEVDQTVVAAVGGYEAWITQAPFADDEFYWAIAPQRDGGPPREPADPTAAGWEHSLAEAAAAAEQATIELACRPVMTPAEAEAYLAANPRFAARVAAHARELAQRLGIDTTEMEGAPPHPVGTVPALGDEDKSSPYVGGTRPATEHAVVVQAMVDRLGAAGISTRVDAEALDIDERDEVLGVAAWSGTEDAAWAEALSRIEDSGLDVSPRWPAAPAAAQLRTLILRGQDAAAVARDIGVEPEWVRGVLTGGITEVDAPRARLLCEAVGLTVSEVFGPASGPQELQAPDPGVDVAAPAPELDVDL